MSTITEAPTVTWRIHRDTYPDTDYGYTWVECYWFERDGERISPTCPSGGCCERTGNLPGGPIGSMEMMRMDFAQYAPDKYKTVKTEKIHNGRYRVGTMCISAEGGA